MTDACSPTSNNNSEVRVCFSIGVYGGDSKGKRRSYHTMLIMGNHSPWRGWGLGVDSAKYDAVLVE